MTNKSKENAPQNCWDFMKCPKDVRETCPAFKRDLGDICWFVMENTATGCYGYDKYNGCYNCPWYKKMNKQSLISKTID